jgi:hypothetical protein
MTELCMYSFDGIGYWAAFDNSQGLDAFGRPGCVPNVTRPGKWFYDKDEA